MNTMCETPRRRDMPHQRDLPSAEERGRRARQQNLGKLLGRSMGDLELQAVPDDFLELLRQADAHSQKTV